MLVDLGQKTTFEFTILKLLQDDCYIFHKYFEASFSWKCFIKCYGLIPYKFAFPTLQNYWSCPTFELLYWQNITSCEFAIMANQSKFNNEEKQFIIDQFLSGKSKIEVKRAFKSEYGHSRRIEKIDPACFKSVFDTYKKKGGRAMKLIESQPRGHRNRDEAAIQRVKSLFEDTSPSPSTREAGRLLNLPHVTVWRYLSTYLSLKFYRVSLHFSFQTKSSLFALLK